MPKDLNKDLSKDFPKDLSKDFSKDLSKDLFKDCSTGITMDPKPMTKSDYAMKKPANPGQTSIPLQNTYSPLASSSRLIRPTSPRPPTTPPTYKSALVINPPTMTVATQKFHSFYKPHITTPAPSPQTQTHFASTSGLPKQIVFEKPHKSLISTLEFEFLLKPATDAWEIAEAYLPKGFHFTTSHLRKTRHYYEFVLMDTDSVEIVHRKNSPTATEIAYSKCKIRKIITLSEWGQRQWTPKTLSQTFEPQYFNYQDYIDAWTNFLFMGRTHSWFIFFCPQCPRIFPTWFVALWSNFGFHPTILPSTVKSSYEEYERLYKDHTYLPTSLGYAFDMHISWIYMWDFDIIEDTSPDGAKMPTLYRLHKIKWWPKANISSLHTSEVQKLFNLQAQTDEPTTSDFQTKKAKLLKQLANCKNDTEMQKILEEIAACSEQTEDKTDETDPFADDFPY